MARSTGVTVAQSAGLAPGSDRCVTQLLILLHARKQLLPQLQIECGLLLRIDALGLRQQRRPLAHLSQTIQARPILVAQIIDGNAPAWNFLLEIMHRLVGPSRCCKAFCTQTFAIVGEVAGGALQCLHHLGTARIVLGVVRVERGDDIWSHLSVQGTCPSQRDADTDPNISNTHLKFLAR
ncbi:hypothetical protein [Xanthomonas oryzae]|uniref:hypothetical protein n=1 Tax=Xanthomonas oryzae TaxID=347 RepID=UPI003CCFE3ED